MTTADANLSPDVATQRMLRHRSAVMTLARMGAKKAVLLALHAQGLKPQHFSAREIAVLADYYLKQHRDRLVAEAAEAIAAWPGATSTVQNSSAEWSAKQGSLPR